MNQNIFNEKKENKLKLKEKYSLLKKNNILWLIKISDKNLIKDLRDAFLILPVNFIIEIEDIETENLWKNIVATWKINDSLLLGFDFLICDNNISWLKKYLEKWIAPIISEKNHFISILKEFNPAKNEWNSYMYETENKWQIFYALIRYLENYKFPYDNKNLVKNILNI